MILFFIQYFFFAFIVAGADEKNLELKFHFIIHADKKSAGKWKDLPLPFPVPVEENYKNKNFDKSGISQIPENLKSVIYKK